MMPDKPNFLVFLVSYCLKGLVSVYRYVISPLLGPRCRYQPTCSEYALIAIDRFGPFKGGWLALRRISRCHPWGGSGYDPVPDAECNHTECKDAKKTAEQDGKVDAG